MSEIALILTEGQMIALLDGGSPSLSCSTVLSDGQSHNISMGLNSSVVMLTLDGETCSLSANGLFSSGIYDLFLGGHPNLP